ncbi:hypothetical protein RchiOBHm_Chr3g0448401 [Rosa chinensis]|uniref:Late embryogenesis abundant protein, LEA-14 n=1 Tax=Rosa chinensis TaxID=74649 RepID=A0A2P6R575_ROSCH|nr:NDR1/HIN1-like protein 3 [Rosa chinensis]PRQ41584.1 hypothetical protein RchiOBHm_Chr3g0448401 [Rosa chinensis]
MGPSGMCICSSISCFVITVTALIIACTTYSIVRAEQLRTPPGPLKIHVTDASLNYTTLDLALNITLENPNKYFHIYYDDSIVIAGYSNKTSAIASVADFHQLENNTTLLTPSLKMHRGDSTDDATGSGKGNYYDIVVKLYLPKWYKSISKKRDNWQSSIHMYTCELKVPLNNGSKSVDAFNTTECAPRTVDFGFRYSWRKLV